MGYIGVCMGTVGGHYSTGIFNGVGRGIFSGFGELPKYIELRKQKALSQAKIASAAKTAQMQAAAALLGITFQQFQAALTDPDVAAWFAAFCAAKDAGSPTPAPPASVLAKVKGGGAKGPAAAGGGLSSMLANMSTTTKIAAGAAAIGVVGAIIYAVSGGGGGGGGE